VGKRERERERADKEEEGEKEREERQRWRAYTRERERERQREREIEDAHVCAYAQEIEDVCSTTESTARHIATNSLHCNRLQQTERIATHCNKPSVFQHSATNCSTLQRTAAQQKKKRIPSNF